ncbi:MAG: RluA family pseudouridine synthase [Anaerococcus sp.]|uniref:RluA family pseudouridine synthase n=1 Tax=Anaerococcus sp. TaxID=1872515 RepID=UPI0026201806|nr:RluA family pseudouridine synthase [Anaerococcus sp.]MCI5972935.1 RluA family pseudouridine synthase [Anaerococcus sp.]MDD6918270.1 RluA family pseudouridine synthase [Peptoniphilaceae bacterium]MDY2927141.1 RluA family pseudouridine synthase [Anaerococcus sp.]
MKYIKYEVHENTSVRQFLKAKNFSKRSIEDILKTGYILNGKKQIKSLNLKKNDKLKIIIEDEKIDYEPIKGDINIVYEDDNSLVISKEANITVNSKNQISLSNYLANYFINSGQESKIRLVNRLDMDTSGLMLIAKNKYSHAYYQKQLEKNTMKKKYLAVVEGMLDIDLLYENKFSYNEKKKNYEPSDKGKISRTYFKSKRINHDFSIIECEILTGRTHQIRASLSDLGHPIWGDKLYGSNKNLDRFLLHSYKLEFTSFYNEENIKLKDYPKFVGFL